MRPPTSASRKGDLVTPARGGREVRAPTGSWRLQTGRLRPGDLDRHVHEVFSGLTQDIDVWLSLSRRFRVDVFFGLFLGDGNEGVSLSPDSLRAGGLRGVTFDFDLYALDVQGPR